MFTTNGHTSSLEITREYIFRYVSELDVFRYYIPTFTKIGVTFCSSLRKDRNPSCSIKVMPSGMLLYRDFANGDSFTCVRYVQSLFGCDYNTALRRIANDLGILSNDKASLLEKKEVADSITKEEKEHQAADIRIKSKPFTVNGLAYWKQYAITEEILNMYNVKQLDLVEINSTQIKLPKNEIGFAYCFGNYRYKILRPEAPRKHKWSSNGKKNTVQGIKQLPSEGGELLIITKSLKDVMSLRAFGYYAIAPQSENTELPEKCISWLKEKWRRIVLYYDNDEPGIAASNNHSLLYEISSICNPTDVEKDFSDYVKERGVDKSRDLITELLKRK